MIAQPFTTTELAARERSDGPPDEGTIRWVSTRSHWDQSTWYLDTDTPGTTATSGGVYWPALPSRLLDHMKKSLWSFLVDPRKSAAPKVMGLVGTASAINYLARWMVFRDYADLGELRPESCEQFLEDLIQYNVNGGYFGPKKLLLAKLAPGEIEEDPDLSEQVVWARVNGWRPLHRQSGALEKLNVPFIGFEPFDGASAKSVAVEVSTKQRQRIPPIPDEIALPILKQAHQDVGVPADDLVRLLEEYTRICPINGRQPSGERAAKANAMLAEFRFGEIAEGAGPWHPSISIDGELTPPVVIRRMMSRIRAACAIVLHAAAGVRISELCSVEAGWDRRKSLPSCVTVRVSKTSLNDILILKGRLSKEEDQPTRAEWVIGSRVRGTEYLPSAVKALQTLEQIYRPWRAVCPDDARRRSLMLSFTAINGLPRTERALGPISSDRLRNDMQKYIAEQVPWDALDIPDSSKHGEDLTEYRSERGANITPHQWRKTFALFIFRIDANMTGALAQQFKHLSLAMTEEAYIGSDPALLQAFDDVQLQQTVRFFFERTGGRSLGAGRVAKLIERHRRSLDKLIEGTSGQAEQRAAIETFVVQQDLRIWFASHGKCLIGLSPKSARCHAVAGTVHFTNRTPAFETRTPDTCAGCECFAIDPEHLPFWQERAAESEAAVEAARRQGRAADYRAIAERARQARSLIDGVQRVGERRTEEGCR